LDLRDLPLLLLPRRLLSPIPLDLLKLEPPLPLSLLPAQELVVLELQVQLATVRREAGPPSASLPPPEVPTGLGLDPLCMLVLQGE
jgi:hypothetical protein